MDVNGQSQRMKTAESGKYLEINRRTLGRYSELIRRSLKDSVFVTMAVHCNWDHDPPHFRSNESFCDFFLRCSKLSLSHEVYAFGISCVSLVPQDESGSSSQIAIKNFNITTCASPRSVQSRASLNHTRQKGYDLNYVASEGCLYYRGRDDRARNCEDCHTLRRIFQEVHGNELNGNPLHPVVLSGSGLPTLIAAYASLSGLPGDNATECLQRIHGLFPGKLLDETVIVSEGLNKDKSFDSSSLGILSFAHGEVDVEDFSSFTGAETDVNLRSLVTKPNTYHPAALDSFHSAENLLSRLLDTEGRFDKCALVRMVKQHGNLLSAPGSGEFIAVLPPIDDKFNPAKKKKIEYDCTISLAESFGMES